MTPCLAVCTKIIFTHLRCITFLQDAWHFLQLFKVQRVRCRDKAYCPICVYNVIQLK